MIDSTFTNVPVAIRTSYTSSSSPPAAGSVILENLSLSNVPTVVQSPSGTVLAGTTGSTTIAAWGEGHQYTPSGPGQFQGAVSTMYAATVATEGGQFICPPCIVEKGSDKANDMQLADRLMKLTAEVVEKKTRSESSAKGCPFKED